MTTPPFYRQGNQGTEFKELFKFAWARKKQVKI